MLEVGQTTLLRDFEACDRFDVMDRLEETDVPALVACGEDDRLTPPKYSEYLQHHLPGSYLRVIGGAGHMVMLERPDALSSIMRDFMSSLK